MKMSFFNKKFTSLTNNKFLKKILSMHKPMLVEYRIFKYDGLLDNHPYIQSWFLSRSEQYDMLLDNLFFIHNNKDQSLSFRRSCREGICGSCAMNVNGVNTLACTYIVDKNKIDRLTIFPLPHMPIIKDLVICMKHFYEQYKSIDPFLKQISIFRLTQNLINPNFSILVIPPKYENYQSVNSRDLLNGLYECIMCACCSTSCPSYWWNRDKYLGPAVLLQSYKWVIDSRDEYTIDRLLYLNDLYKLYRCHTILNCVECCPKKLNPAKSISSLKSLIKYY